MSAALKIVLVGNNANQATRGPCILFGLGSLVAPTSFVGKCRYRVIRW